VTILEILRDAANRRASDIFLIGGLPLTLKVSKKQVRIEPEHRLMQPELEELISELYRMVERERKAGQEEEDDFSFAVNGVGRYRANVFYQRGTIAAVIRVIRFGVPDPGYYHVPESILGLSSLTGGLVLVTGAAASGKTTTLACIIDAINSASERTIITMEDPIEIVHNHKKGIVIQREISTDTESFHTALRAALRESPDVMLIGEIRDGETMEAAMTAAETGQLIFSSLHTLSAADTVDRILDYFPDKQQHQIRAQLSRTLRSVICQKLVPAIGGGMVPAFEIMHVTPAIQNLIREGKTYQFNSLIMEGVRFGMCTMDGYLQNLVREGVIEPETAVENSTDRLRMERRLNISEKEQ